MQKLIDFSDCPYSFEHGFYGGRAGDKDGILYQDKEYMIKYPKLSKYLAEEADFSYITSPLSEYLGSHIYEILDFPVHETLLGYRNNKLVVACKDFCTSSEIRLMEMRTIKNAANRELETQVEEMFDPSVTEEQVNLDEEMLHLEYNPILRQVPGATDRFWDMVVIDILIDNNDRNNGNWGLLADKKTKSFSLAPIYGNSNAFFSETPDNRIAELLQTPEKEMIQIGGRTPYVRNGKLLSVKRLLKQDIPGLQRAVIRNVPKIGERLDEIWRFIDDIPNTACCPIRKEWYKQGLGIRMKKLLEPAYNKAVDNELNTWLQSLDREFVNPL